MHTGSTRYGPVRTCDANVARASNTTRVPHQVDHHTSSSVTIAAWETSLQHDADRVRVDGSHPSTVVDNSQRGGRREAACGSAVANRDERYGLRRRPLRLRSQEAQLPAAARWRRSCHPACAGTEDPSDSGSRHTYRARHGCVVARGEMRRSLSQSANGDSAGRRRDQAKGEACSFWRSAERSGT